MTVFSTNTTCSSSTRNKKFASKEFPNQIKVVAIKITNHTGQTLRYGTNYKIFSGDREADILPVSEVAKHIKESVPTYLLYLFLTEANIPVDEGGTKERIIPIGLFLGPAVTILNMRTAATANKHFRQEMEEYNLLETEIPNGETGYGLVGIQSMDFAPLYMKVLDK
ncbi:hypothetical protein ACQ86N_17410 [Puia sp. P3]|uniref:hypothetical protein n=1 Tax=Puia sp. P3 TaxID=3423952 RepID=UPI003D678673